MFPDNAVHDRQSQPRSLGPGAEKGIKELWNLIGGNAHPCVFNMYDCYVLLVINRFGANAQQAALRHCLKAVNHEVEESLLELILRSQHVWISLRVQLESDFP